MKKILLVGVVLVLLTSLGGVIGCGGGGSPEGVVKDYFNAIDAGEFDRAEQCVAPSIISPKLPKQLKGNIQEVEILDVTTGEALGTKGATVKVKVIASRSVPGNMLWREGENTRVVTLEKTDQGWKISTIQ